MYLVSFVCLDLNVTLRVAAAQQCWQEERKKDEQMEFFATNPTILTLEHTQMSICWDIFQLAQASEFSACISAEVFYFLASTHITCIWCNSQSFFTVFTQTRGENHATLMKRTQCIVMGFSFMFFYRGYININVGLDCCLFVLGLGLDWTIGVHSLPFAWQL